MPTRLLTSHRENERLQEEVKKLQSILQRQHDQHKTSGGGGAAVSNSTMAETSSHMHPTLPQKRKRPNDLVEVSAIAGRGFQTNTRQQIPPPGSLRANMWGTVEIEPSQSIIQPQEYQAPGRHWPMIGAYTRAGNHDIHGFNEFSRPTTRHSTATSGNGGTPHFTNELNLCQPPTTPRPAPMFPPSFARSSNPPSNPLERSSFTTPRPASRFPPHTPSWKTSSTNQRESSSPLERSSLTSRGSSHTLERTQGGRVSQVPSFPE